MMFYLRKLLFRVFIIVMLLVFIPTTMLGEQKMMAISYLVSTADRYKYCNGANMDSAGYRKTITKLVTQLVPKQNLSREAFINETIKMASGRDNVIFGSYKTVVKIKGNTAYIRPIDGWAGISIFMCAWQPLVEVNLLRFPEIKKVVWLSCCDQDDFDKWAAL